MNNIPWNENAIVITIMAVEGGSNKNLTVENNTINMPNPR
jgi:hypothetical protein